MAISTPGADPSLPPDLKKLQEQVLHATHLLPAQGPINVFIHHNTLHAFENMDFDTAVQHGAKVFGCEPYLPEERFREELARGRIRISELHAVLQQDLGDSANTAVAGLSPRLSLREALLLHPLLKGAGNELEANALMASSQNKEAAKRFLDWTLSDAAVNEYYTWKEIVTVSGGTMPQSFRDAGLPEDISTVMYDMDFVWSAENRDRVLEQWQAEFEDE